MANITRTTYRAVVETGSCSMDYRRWEERATCGHDHKTIEAAEACLEKKQRWYCDHGRISGALCRHCLGYAQGETTSALWYNGTIHTNLGERA